MTRDADDSGYELPEEIREYLAALDAAREAHFERFKRFEQEVSDLPSLEKAERWLWFVAETRASPGWGGGYGDEEALVYLRSRGYECRELIDALRDEWRKDIDRVVERGSYISTTDKEGTKIERSPLVPESGVRDIRRVYRAVIPDFWSGADHQELHIDAAMLRAAHWCDMGGFNDWWERLAADENESALLGGVEQVPMSYWAANMARCDLAYDLMPAALTRAVAALQVSIHRDQEGPWIQWNPFRRTLGEGPAFIGHLGQAANLTMSVPLVQQEIPAVVERACEVLLRSQDDNGAWATWDIRDEPSINTTARAMHGLVFCQPHGWERAVDRAAAWLLDQQERAGYWQEDEQRDAKFLTVLVLDAVTLAGGGNRWTLERPRRNIPSRSQGAAGPTEYRFEVAVSFPGEARNLVRDVVDHLVSELGRDSVLYDEFHEAEFARPNLDTYLQRLYRNESRLNVVFIGADYERKEWPGLEWRAVRDLIKERQDDRIMLLRLDDGLVPGLFGIDGYIDTRGREATDLGTAILERLRQLREG